MGQSPNDITVRSKEERENIYNNILDELVNVMNNPLYSYKHDFMNMNNISKIQLENSIDLQCGMLDYVIKMIKQNLLKGNI